MTRSFPMFFLLLFATSIHAQVSLSSRSLRLLDSAMLSIGMTTSDMSMPHDWVAPDRHRLPFHDRLFTTPLAAFDELDAFSANCKTWSVANQTAFMEQSMAVMQLGYYRRVLYANTMKTEDVNRKLKIDPSVKAGFVGSVLLYRTLGAVLTAIDACQDARDRFRNLKVVHDMCDSLWRIANDDESTSLFDSYNAETKARKRAELFFTTADPLLFEDIYIQGFSLYQHMLEFATSFNSVKELLNDSVSSVILETPIGRIAIGGSGNDVYVGEFTLIIDVGGNDVYNLTNTSKASALKTPVQCIVDLNGNDTYVGGEFCLGGAAGGVSIVIDRGGDDVYKATNFSLGSGLFGVGILHDFDGNDQYIGGTNTQGCGIFGVGLLLDQSGNDTYRCDAQGQGFGGTRGVGILVDHNGNDQYLASSPFVDALRYESHYTTFTQGAALGYRPIASGGVGLLLEYGGNDNYVTDIYGQGTGYWFGLGAIADFEGEDKYQAYQYAQGAGVHFATGLVRDYKGSDVYVSHGVSQGCGHDVALGALIDEEGNDVYVCESLSQGGGNANAVSLFVDESGSDSYIAHNTSNTMGFSDFRRSYGMIGVFVDGGGTDYYSETSKNNTTSVKSTYGVFADLSVTSEQKTEAPLPTYVEMPLANDVDSLFIQASAAPLKFQNNVVPARDKIAGMGKTALPFLVEYFRTPMPRERLSLEYILPKIHAEYPDTTRLVMIEGLQSENLAEIALMCTVAGKVKDTTLTPYLVALSRDTSWKVRRTVAQTMSEIQDTAALSTLQTLLSDVHPMVRSRAAYAIGISGGSSALSNLRLALDDEDQLVRNGAIEGLIRGLKRDMRDVVSIWQSITNVAMLTSTHRLWLAADTTEANVALLVQYLRSAPVLARQNIYRLMPQATEFWQRNAYQMSAAETMNDLASILQPYVELFPAPVKSKKRRR